MARRDPITGASFSKDQPQTMKKDNEEDSKERGEQVEQEPGQPEPISDPDAPTHKQPTAEPQPKDPEEHTGSGFSDDIDAPSDQTRRPG